MNRKLLLLVVATIGLMAGTAQAQSPSSVLATACPAVSTQVGTCSVGSTTNHNHVRGVAVRACVTTLLGDTGSTQDFQTTCATVTTVKLHVRHHWKMIGVTLVKSVNVSRVGDSSLGTHADTTSSPASIDQGHGSIDDSSAVSDPGPANGTVTHGDPPCVFDGSGAAGASCAPTSAPSGNGAVNHGDPPCAFGLRGGSVGPAQGSPCEPIPVSSGGQG